MKKFIRDEEGNTCLTYAVAKYFNEDPTQTPFFIGYKDWLGKLKKHFRDRGYLIYPTLFKWKYLSDKNKIYLVQGLSPRSKATNKYDRRSIQHAVLYKGRKLYYDPSLGGRGLKGTPGYFWYIVKLPKPK